ncbi:hypothetical protein [Paraburkholderia sediminicola]|uniref:hypothetical protein n=1 Tax=Paraburkholderia sediminicola TaxID=458836 RepID=UPI0038BBD0A2
MLPTAITVAELPVEPDALQAFALEQNRLACVLWAQLETLQHQIAQANRARFGVSSERLAGQADCSMPPRRYPFRPSPPRLRSRATPARGVQPCRRICRVRTLNTI